MIGLNVDQYAHDLTIDERRAVDAWLRLIGQERNAWIEYALLDESGTTLSIKRYLLNEDGNPTLSGDVSSPRVFMKDAGGGLVQVSEDVSVVVLKHTVTVPQPPPVLRSLPLEADAS